VACVRDGAASIRWESSPRKWNDWRDTRSLHPLEAVRRIVVGRTVLRRGQCRTSGQIDYCAVVVVIGVADINRIAERLRMFGRPLRARRALANPVARRCRASLSSTIRFSRTIPARGRCNTVFAGAGCGWLLGESRYGKIDVVIVRRASRCRASLFARCTTVRT